jgi:NADPH2:quinone reductase
MDYRAADVVSTLRAQGRTFDVVFDVFGNLGYRRSRDLLTPAGRYCSTVPTLPILWHTLLTRRSSGRRGVIAFTGLRAKDAVRSDLRETAALAQSGIIKPVVDTAYPLDRVAEAHAHVERGKTGNIVLTMG